ncbi:MAG TPA: serine/threonine-protein phosphatase [Desulfobulbus sp.]|nr:serine/threonine-protein phosphatase [Desulfobulbus sp.]
MKTEEGTTRIGNFFVGYAGCSDPGKVRSHNEDDFLLLPDKGIFCLTDGVGGNQGGKTASTIALESVKSAVCAHSPLSLFTGKKNISLDKILHRANVEVYNRRKMLRSNAATTIVMIRFLENSLEVAHVGDSRMYHWNGQSLIQRTRDHSLVEQLYRDNLLSKKERDNHPQRHVITRAIGACHDLKAQIQQIDIQSGDGIMLCSDGLTTMLPHEKMQRFFRKKATDVSHLSRLLIDAANKAGGRDNITVILLHITDDAGH